MSSKLQYSRRVPLSGLYNFRDLGGYRSALGGSVRWEAVYRADGIHRVAGSDLDLVQSLGLRCVIDLRTPAEVEAGRAPVDALGAASYHHLPLLETLEETVRPAAVADPASALADNYVEMLQGGSRSVARAFELMADADNMPLVFHCAAGKDRTGILAALLLSVLGVPDEEIAQDYALSAPAVERMVTDLLSAASSGSHDVPVIPEWLLSAPPAAMLQTMESVRSRYGSAEGYLAAIGVSGGTIEDLRSSLLCRR